VTDPRVAGPADLAEIARLEVEIFGANAWSEDAVLAEHSTAVGSTRHLMVSTHSGVVVGYAALMCAGEAADILRIAVLPEHRRQGRATALLGALVDGARARGCRRALLEVAADNSEALEFYSVHGFEEINRRRRYYSGGSDALVLRKSL